ncbi:MAG: 2-oxoglutarate and iron-dependent oxygenase domain-containing protein [Aeromicrobium sp.]
MTFHVPTVDITPYVTDGTTAERASVAAQIDRACREVGFIQITGHGVPVPVLDGLAEAMDGFFGCPLEEKRSYIRPPAENRGYSAPKSESLSLSLGVESAGRMADFFEAFNVGRTVHDHPGVSMPDHYADNTWPELSGFEPRVEAYFDEAERVAETMVAIFADALGLPSGFFDDHTNHSINVLRMNNYALPAGTDVTLDGELTGMGEHTDFGIVTILWADQVRGLQVLSPDHAWHDVSPADGALLINLGDLMARWTNERWMSTLHRVKPPIVDGTIQRRRSAAFFHDGNADAVVTTLASCIDEDHPDLYAPVTVADHIAAKLAGSRTGKPNLAAEREAERVLQSR